MAQKMKSSIHLCVIVHKKKVSNVTESQNAHDQKPDHCMDLKGARVAWCTGGKSKRSHVFEVTQTVLSLTMLLQDDSLQVAAEWFEEVRYLASLTGFIIYTFNCKWPVIPGYQTVLPSTEFKIQINFLRMQF